MIAGNETFSEVNNEFALAGYPVLAESKTIASGAGALVAGTVLGKVTATGKFIASDEAAVDGSQTAAAILAVDVDATAADVDNVPIFVSGLFDGGKLTYAGNHDADTVNADFEGTPLFVRTALALQS
ncbi:head decoration protein [Hyphobacterium sp.]|uniref:head decoration protein n=1 Tax=Hyphobacterium sp. TaxID=2004662 RepID=UPI003BA93F6F